MNKKVCVIGAGHWGKNHIKTLYEMDCLKGVVELKKDRAQIIGKLYKGVKIVTLKQHCGWGLGFQPNKLVNKRKLNIS